MDKDTKIVIGAIVILLALVFIFSSTGDMSEFTGQSFLNKLKFWGGKVPVKDVGSIKSPALDVKVPGERIERKGYEPPSTAKCTDSDGLNLGVKGYCVGSGGEKKEDLCDSIAVVIEQFCDSSNICLVRKYDCPSSYECKDGACKPKERYTPGKEIKCTDSDGGKNYNIKGYAKNSLNPEGIWDKCTELLGKPAVEEQYCAQNGNIYFSVVVCPNGCKDGACISGGTGTVLIEKNFGVLNFISSSVLRDSCELMELEGKEDPHTCDSYRANYDIEGQGLGSVEAIVEKRVIEPINKEETVNAIANYFINNQGMSLHIEGVGGQKVYTLMKSIGVKRDAVVLWASGNKIIAIGVDDWDTTLIDDDIFEDLLDAYLVKYPSDLKF